MNVCSNCGAQLQPGALFCTGCGAKVEMQNTAYTQPNSGYGTPPNQSYSAAPNPSQGMNFDFNTNTATSVVGARFEYKVLTQKDKWFSGKFDPMVLEQAINAYAQQGWRVIGCATADIPGFGTARQEFITLLEREIK